MLYADPGVYNITNGYKIESNEKLWAYLTVGGIVVCLLDKYLIINRKSYHYGRRKHFPHINMFQISDFEENLSKPYLTWLCFKQTINLMQFVHIHSIIVSSIFNFECRKLQIILRLKRIYFNVRMENSSMHSQPTTRTTMIHNITFHFIPAQSWQYNKLTCLTIPCYTKRWHKNMVYVITVCSTMHIKQNLHLALVTLLFLQFHFQKLLVYEIWLKLYEMEPVKYPDM